MLFSNTSLIGQGLSTLCALLEVCSITLSREGRQSLLRVDLQFLRMSIASSFLLFPLLSAVVVFGCFSF